MKEATVNAPVATSVQETSGYSLSASVISCFEMKAFVAGVAAMERADRKKAMMTKILLREASRSISRTVSHCVHVFAAGQVYDSAHSEKEGSLEQGVEGKVKESCNIQQFCIPPYQEGTEGGDYVIHLRHRMECQEPFSYPSD